MALTPEASSTAPAAATEGHIVWDPARRRFETSDGLSYLQYLEQEEAAMELLHTYVPRSERGRGVASQLCRAACAHARQHNLRIIPTCSYVADTFLPRNPDCHDLVLPRPA